MKQQMFATLVACAVLTAACTAGGTATVTDDAVVSADPTVAPTAVDQVEPTAQPVPDPTATPVPATPTPVPQTPAPVGRLAEFAPGDCFDNASADPDDAEPSDPIDCQGEHEYEVFFAGQTGDGPDVPYRSDTDFTDALFVDFCDPATIEFGGAAWDVLPFGTTVWTPSEADWAAGDRTFLCTAEAGLRDENIYKIGTAAAGDLASDEGIVARSTLAGQRDFFFSFQGSTLYPLTEGSYELPNLSPAVLRSGFLFSSPLQDVDGPSSQAYDFNFDTRVVTRLVTGVEGWEVASPQFLSDPPAFVFAARETADDDWDIYLSRSDDDVVALADTDADDHWPTLTPDQTRIVYSSDNDIWIMDVDGSNQQQLTAGAGGNFESAVSPDGTKIAFASNRSGDDDIWLMDIDGDNQVNLTQHPGNEAWPFFSQDGSRIYFQTDRLGVRSNIMLMELDGSNQSYFSFEFMTNGAVLPDEITARYKTELPTISDVLSSVVEGVVGGGEGQVGEIAHTSGRLVATLPSGWEYQEIDGDDPAAMVAAPSIAAFNSTWESDGALFTLIEAADAAVFNARIDAAVAATDSSCVEDRQSIEIDGSRTITERRYVCGEDSSAVVVGIYEAAAQIGLLFEGQWDGIPSNDADEATISAIGESLQWG